MGSGTGFISVMVSATTVDITDFISSHGVFLDIYLGFDGSKEELETD